MFYWRNTQKLKIGSDMKKKSRSFLVKIFPGTKNEFCWKQVCIKYKNTQFIRFNET